MKKLLVAIVVVVAAITLGPGALDRARFHLERDSVRQRVDRLLAGMASEPPDEQLAMSAWGADKLILNEDELRDLYDEWSSFWRASGLAEGRGWAVKSLEPAAEEGDWLVTVESDGDLILLLVPETGPLERSRR